MPEPVDYVTLKLPQAFDGLRFDIYNYTAKEIKFIEEEPYWDAELQKWRVKIIIQEVDAHLQVHRDGA